MGESRVGFEPDEIRTAESTRSARLKWVIVADDSLPLGRIVNAAACVAAVTTNAVPGLLAHGGMDRDGSAHPGLPWAGCTVLAADEAKMRQIRDKAAKHPEIFVADMPTLAQETRVYDEYIEQLAEATGLELRYAAVSVVGPRKAVDRIVGGLALLR